MQFFFTQSNKLNSKTKVTFQSHPLLLCRSVLQTTVNVLELPSWSPDINPIKHLCSQVKMAVHHLSSNLPQDLHRNMSEYVKSRRAKLVTAAKDASTDLMVQICNILVPVLE